MKIVVLTARLLLGLIFVVFGLNGFLHFLPMQSMPGLPGQFFGALVQSNYTVLIFLVQLVGGVLLLAGQFVPLALTLLAPVIVNILTFHILMAPAGLPPGLLATILWFIVFYRYRRAFAPLLSNAKED